MSKAIITIEDSDNIGNMNVGIEFDPPLEDGKSTDENATAQYIGAKALEFITEFCFGTITTGKSGG